MKKIFIFGHQNPDTDSVTSAISLSFLKNKLGFVTSPRIIGDINAETKYVLNYFNIEEPKYLNDVNLQIKDIDYYRDYFLLETDSLLDAYIFFTENKITGVPVIDENQNFRGLITLKMIAKEFFGDAHLDLEKNVIKKLDTSYKNIIKCLKGEELLKFDNEISGEILLASFGSEHFIKDVSLTSNHILIVGDRYSIINYGIDSKVKLLILVGNATITDDLLEKAKENKVNIIRTSLGSFNTARYILLADYIKKITEKGERNAYFFDTDNYEYFIEESKRLQYNNYPILDKDKKCLGLIRLTDISKKNRKKVILVDHNEKDQSVNGLEEADILEIIDHHNIGSLSTTKPINIRNMIVGSTNTIIYQMFLENKIDIPFEIAGLMMSGILSDTLILTSPTTTEYDKIALNELAQITKLDYKEYGYQMLKEGTSFLGKTKEEIINIDFKILSINNKKIGISQILSFDPLSIINEKDSYLEALLKIKDYQRLDGALILITDILNNGAYILYSENMRSILIKGYKLDEIYQGIFLPLVISRKKQVVPVIIDMLS